jgi:hypothetical protein
MKNTPVALGWLSSNAQDRLCFAARSQAGEFQTPFLGQRCSERENGAILYFRMINPDSQPGRASRTDGGTLGRM